jgi:hypothetical protein
MLSLSSNKYPQISLNSPRKACFSEGVILLSEKDISIIDRASCTSFKFSFRASSNAC